ncbi:signalosome subunit 3 [Aspergillus keveii]|uniref:COP9 signalosome complex subunit 3 n=1 Tax=Aspergillus keveii TaxID=714993 RepID=A0ABR4FIE8_9EURO
MMSDILTRLSAVPSRPHGATETTDETYDRQLRDLVTYLKQPGLVPSTTDPNEYLQVLSPSTHSLSFLYLLRFHIQQAQKRTKRDIPDVLQPGGILWKWAVRFLRSFDPIQIRYSIHEWRQLVEVVASAALTTSKSFLALKVTRDALEQLGLCGIFTSTHLLLVRLALLSSSYTYALPITNQLLYHFPTDADHVHHGYLSCSEHAPTTTLVTNASGISSKLTHRDHLQYFLYSAMIYMALKKWDEACHCLNAVITSPTSNAVSKIMVEAYKKWILVNLLGYGKVISCSIVVSLHDVGAWLIDLNAQIPPTSKMIAPHVMRVYQSVARPYISVAEAFEKGELQKMITEIDLGQTMWQADKNTGLVSQLFEAYDKFVIVKLGKTFSALTMADVLQRTSSTAQSPLQIEEFVASLVMSGALRANLSHTPHENGTTMLRLSLGSRSDTCRQEHIRAELIRARTALNAIAQGVTQTDQTLELSRENLQFLAKSQKWSGNSDKISSSGEAGGGGDIDEDIMGDGQ